MPLKRLSDDSSDDSLWIQHLCSSWHLNIIIDFSHLSALIMIGAFYIKNYSICLLQNDLISKILLIGKLICMGWYTLRCTLLWKTAHECIVQHTTSIFDLPNLWLSSSAAHSFTSYLMAQVLCLVFTVTWILLHWKH